MKTFSGSGHKTFSKFIFMQKIFRKNSKKNPEVTAGFSITSLHYLIHCDVSPSMLCMESLGRSRRLKSSPINFADVKFDYHQGLAGQVTGSIKRTGKCVAQNSAYVLRVRHHNEFEKISDNAISKFFYAENFPKKSRVLSSKCISHHTLKSGDNSPKSPYILVQFGLLKNTCYGPTGHITWRR